MSKYFKYEVTVKVADTSLLGRLHKKMITKTKKGRVYSTDKETAEAEVRQDFKNWNVDSVKIK